jgi:hypothetical protein
MSRKSADAVRAAKTFAGGSMAAAKRNGRNSLPYLFTRIIIPGACDQNITKRFRAAVTAINNSVIKRSQLKSKI